MASSIFTSLLPHTRIHALRKDFGDQVQVFVKREDEAGFAISGNKKRKYASLIPWIIENQVEEVAIIGGDRSNNVIGICQLLIEQGIRPTPFLREAHGAPGPGNPLLLRLLVPEQEIHWIPSADWPQAHEIAKSYAQSAPHKVYVLPEGANCAPALSGALTLMEDILRNEKENNLHFDHILIDSGTGLTAGGLLLANAQLPAPRSIHVLLLADDEAYFQQQLVRYKSWTGHQPELPPFSLHVPQTAKSFGSVNRTTLDGLIQIARAEGILTDPIYSAKLFNEAAHIIEQEKITGNLLIIHSGGAQTLPGFAEKLFPLL